MEVRDSTGQVVPQSTVGLEYGFQGRRHDPETGLMYFRARMYDPVTGRFIQRDPVWDPNNVGNAYTFVGNNPITGRDPTGEIAWVPVILLGLYLGSEATGWGASVYTGDPGTEVAPSQMLWRAGTGHSMFGGRGGTANSSGFHEEQLSTGQRVFEGVAGVSAMVGGSAGLAGLTGRTIAAGWLAADAAANVGLGAYAYSQGDRWSGGLQMALGGVGVAPVLRGSRTLQRWVARGQENDSLYWALSGADQGNYILGQRTVSSGFWRANNLDDFTRSIARPVVSSADDLIDMRGGFMTAGQHASGAAEVAGVVARGRYLRAEHGRRVAGWNIPALLWDLGAGARHTAGTGPTPELRRFLRGVDRTLFGGN